MNSEPLTKESYYGSRFQKAIKNLPRFLIIAVLNIIVWVCIVCLSFNLFSYLLVGACQLLECFILLVLAVIAKAGILILSTRYY